MLTAFQLRADRPAEGFTRYYITVTGTERPGVRSQPGVTVEVGELVAQMAQLTPVERQKVNKLRYPSHAEALNYLSRYGWQLAEAYAVNAQGMVQTTWILYKDVTKGLELSEGLALEEE